VRHLGIEVDDALWMAGQPGLPYLGTNSPLKPAKVECVTLIAIYKSCEKTAKGARAMLLMIFSKGFPNRMSC
jgi:hypothetical protein